jgi:cell division protein FtsW (lipid II flippase)
MNRGITRARVFVGGFLLAAAVIVWAVGLLMSPRGSGAAQGTEYVRDVVVVYLRNSALATIGLAVFSAFLLFPARRPQWPARDWAIALLIALLALTSIYQLVWLRTAVLG